MSRNLCTTACAQCPAPRVCLIEPPRPGTEADFGRYVSEYGGMTVAHAECPLCGAQYLAWIDQRTITATGQYSLSHREHAVRHPPDSELDYYDLSYRASFDDEPHVEDMARFHVEKRVEYVVGEPIMRCTYGSDLTKECSRCLWDTHVRNAEERGLWSVFWKGPNGERRPCMTADNFSRISDDPCLVEKLEYWQKSGGSYVIEQHRRGS